VEMRARQHGRVDGEWKPVTRQLGPSTRVVEPGFMVKRFVHWFTTNEDLKKTLNKRSNKIQTTSRTPIIEYDKGV